MKKLLNNFRLSKNDIVHLLEDSLAWIVSFAMFIYGIAKHSQFDKAIEVEKTLPELSGLELMWGFYSYSYPFVIILGVIEITGGLLLLFKRTRIIGCLVLSTVLINIILQDYFYEVPAIRPAIFYQLILIIILIINRNKLIKGIKEIMKVEPEKMVFSKKFYMLFISFLIFIVIRIFEYFISTTTF